MEESITNIKKANIAKRVLAMIMDGALTIFTFIFLMSLVFYPIANNCFDYEDKMATGYENQVFSKLYVLLEKVDNDYKIIENNDDLKAMQNDSELVPLYYCDQLNEEQIKERIKYYYCCYKTGENLEFPKGSPEATKNETIETWVNENIEPVTSKEELQQLAFNAVNDLFDSNFMVEINKSLKLQQGFIILPSFLISFGIFYILVPMLYKNGETFAKKWLHLSFVARNGYSVKKRQIIFRQIVLMCYVAITSTIVGIGLTSFATLGVGVVIYLIPTLISKQNISPADYLALTMLVDANKSVWFESKDDEEKHSKRIDENISKLNEYKPENKNLIQVGTTILDKEIEEEVKNNKGK